MEPSHLRNYTYSQIENIVINLLNSAYPDLLDIPVDIDLVAEKCKDVEIVLMGNLASKFNTIATLIFLHKSQKGTIVLDANTDSFNRPRANFSVALELGHAVLHHELYRDCKTIDDAVMLNKRIKHSYMKIERGKFFCRGGINTKTDNIQ